MGILLRRSLRDLKMVAMDSKNDIVRKLMLLGFSEYEARILATLAIIGPATAREIHEYSGIPRPKIYDILRKLTKKRVR